MTLRTEAKAIAVRLPEPPSTNVLFRNVPGKGRVKTDAYKAWLSHAGWELQAQKPGRVAGHYALDIFTPPTRKDVDNLAKAISDLLVKHGVVEDDSKAARVAVETVFTADALCVSVRPWADAARLSDQFEWPWRIAA